MVDGEYDVAVVGGGPAGLTAALYTTRLGLDTALVDRGGGRAAMMLDTHNVIGITEETSGIEFLRTAKAQVAAYGATVYDAFVSDVRHSAPGDDTDSPNFQLDTAEATIAARRLVLATGFTDARADPPLPPTGRGLHYCLHCDAYMFVDEPVYVMGTDDSAAYVAMILLNFTDHVDVLTRTEDPDWTDETDELLSNHPVDVVHEAVTGVNRDADGWLESFEFADGSVREYRGGFPMYGSDYNTDLHEGLGCDLHEDGTVVVDEQGRTSVDGVYAVGDVTPGPSQIPTAMGEGARAGIAIQKALRRFPRSLEAIAAEGPVTESDVPAVSQSLLANALAHEGHAAGPRTDVTTEATDD